jgi:hypothetical protein
VDTGAKKIRPTIEFFDSELAVLTSILWLFDTPSFFEGEVSMAAVYFSKGRSCPGSMSESDSAAVNAAASASSISADSDVSPGSSSF